jgi:hypothetical protein
MAPSHRNNLIFTFNGGNVWIDISKQSLMNILVNCHNSPLNILYFQHVMKFAEITQEVQVSQPSGIKVDFGFTPGRRKANHVSCVGYSILSRDGVTIDGVWNGNQIYWIL